MEEMNEVARLKKERNEGGEIVEESGVDRERKINGIQVVIPTNDASPLGASRVSPAAPSVIRAPAATVP